MLCVVVGMFAGAGLDNEAGANVAAREAVSRRLLSRSSAEFSDLHPNRIEGSPGRWVVYGQVSAVNAFGVRLNHSFTCHVRFDRKQDDWSCESVDISP